MDFQKLLAGRLLAAQAHPYLAGALWAMVIVPSSQVFTMAVDRYWRCYVSPSFVAACDVGELAGVWLHEVGHLLRNHHVRGDQLWERSRAGEGSLDPAVVYARQAAGGSWLDPEHHDLERLRMNIAMDCEINDDDQVYRAPEPGRHAVTPLEPYRPLRPDPDPIRLPEGGLTPSQFGLGAGLPFETYLRDLPDSVVEGRKVWMNCGSGAHGGDAPWDLGPDDGHPLSSAQAEVIRIRTADQIRRGQGNAPGRWRRWAEDVGRPSQDWNRLLSAAVRAGLGAGGGQGDHTFLRPSRRAAALGGRVVLPALTRPTPQVAVVIDTSGSVNDGELGAALAETAGIIRAAGGRKITVYSCDSAVQTVQQVASAREITLAGGGGTNLVRGMSRALAARPAPDVLVVLTDGRTGWPLTRPRVPVVVGVFGPEPELNEDGIWRPAPPPPWARSVRIQ